MRDNWLKYHEEPVTLHSGATSHWLIDGQALFDDPNVRRAVLDVWAYAIWMHSPQVDKPLILGIPTGGTPWAEALAQHVPGAVLLDEYGRVLRDTPVFLVDDVVTTGASFDEYPLGPRLVVVRRTSKYPTVQVTAKWMDVQLPIEMPA